MEIINIEHSLCKIDGKFCETLSELKKHLRKNHKLSIKDYFSKYFPRFDLLTKEEIPFKTYDQYFSDFFVNRKNMVDFCKKQATYFDILEWFKARHFYKPFEVFPSQVELKTIKLPSISMLRNLANSTKVEHFLESNLSQVLKLKEVRRLPTGTEKRDVDFGKYLVFVDSREQTPWKLSCRLEKCKLDFGDYCVREPCYSKVFLERKTIQDFYSTLGANQIERFHRECERCRQYKSSLIVVVDGSLKDVIEYGRFKNKGIMNPECIFFNMRGVMQKYHNVQFVFDKQATSLVEIILSQHETAGLIDWQYYSDTQNDYRL